MDRMAVIVWILPVIFMLHDFEEIIMIGAWKIRYRTLLESLGFSKDVMSIKIPYKDFRSASSFSVAVLILFFMFSLVALLSCLFHSYILWYGVCFAFVFHCLLHFKMCLRLKIYVPGVFSAILFFPVGIFLLWYSTAALGYTFFVMIFSVFIGLLAVVVTFIGLHRCISRFEGWLNAYANDERD